MENIELIKLAKEARSKAYAPYSRFFVGAALLCKSGKVYTGCNVENASYGATVCAERVALGNAIANGESQFVKIAIVGGKSTDDKPCFPCGICRQFMSELCAKDLEVVLSDGDKCISYKLSELLPHSFNEGILR